MNRTFNETDHYQLTHIGPIDVDTILKLDAANGKVLNSWGASLFFFPHGMTIDHHGNIWVTDVALHQVFKFKPKSRYPSITIGRRFQPGSVPSQLCKPTAVAVATTGEVFNIARQFSPSMNLFNDWVIYLYGIDFCCRWLLQQSNSEIQCGRPNLTSHPTATRIFITSNSTWFNFARAFGFDLYR